MSLATGLSADSVFARERAYSGYGNTKAPTSGHARSLVTGTLANALGSSLSDSSGDSEARGDAEDESDTAAGDELRETGTAASFRAVPRAAAAAGGASASAASASGVHFASSTVPEEVPSNLWELLPCVKESIRRAFSPLLTT